MKVHEKIKFLRQTQGWSQEEMANKLGMSPNGYGHIERGKTNLDVSRLEQIAELFEMPLTELFNLNEKNSFYLAGTSNDQSHWHVGSSEFENIQLKAELEKQLAINEMKDKEIAYLKEIIALLKKDPQL